jgi:hypothetical protein
MFFFDLAITILAKISGDSNTALSGHSFPTELLHRLVPPLEKSLLFYRLNPKATSHCYFFSSLRSSLAPKLSESHAKSILKEENLEAFLHSSKWPYPSQQLT